jgi:hypothetical protein
VLIRYGFTGDALQAVQQAADIIRRNHIRNEYVVENHVALAEALVADGERVLALGGRARRRELRRIAPTSGRLSGTRAFFPTVWATR